MFWWLCYRFLCIRKDKVSSPGSALYGAIDQSQKSSSSNELLQLCSGHFSDSPVPLRGRQLPPSPADSEDSDSEGSEEDSQEVRELLGLPQQLKPRITMDLDTQDGGVDEVLGLCSGVFPSQQQQQAVLHGHTPKTADGNQVETSDGMSNDSRDNSDDDDDAGKDESGEGPVERWALRHQLTLSEGGGEKNIGAWRNMSEEDEDIDMPLIRRRKVQLKPTRE